MTKRKSPLTVLARKLNRHAEKGQQLLRTEAIFSMDGAWKVEGAGGDGGGRAVRSLHPLPWAPAGLPVTQRCDKRRFSTFLTVSSFPGGRTESERLRRCPYLSFQQCDALKSPLSELGAGRAARAAP